MGERSSVEHKGEWVSGVCICRVSVCIDEPMGGRLSIGWTYELIDVWMCGLLIDGRAVYGQTDGWMDGRMTI